MVDKTVDSLRALATNAVAQTKFWSRTRVTRGHVVWTGYVRENGRPGWEFEGTQYPVRRVFRALTGMPLDDELMVVKVCDEPNCLSHTELAKHPQSIKAHCPTGHELTTDNLVPYVTRERRCLTCHRAQSRAAVARARARRRAVEDAARVSEYMSKPVPAQEARKLADAILRTAGV